MSAYHRRPQGPRWRHRALSGNQLNELSKLNQPRQPDSTGPTQPHQRPPTANSTQAIAFRIPISDRRNQSDLIMRRLNASTPTMVAIRTACPASPFLAPTRTSRSNSTVTFSSSLFLTQGCGAVYGTCRRRAHGLAVSLARLSSLRAEHIVSFAGTLRQARLGRREPDGPAPGGPAPRNHA